MTDESDVLLSVVLDSKESARRWRSNELLNRSNVGRVASTKREEDDSARFVSLSMAGDREKW